MSKDHPLTPWHPVDIKSAVQKAGTNLTQLAVSNGLNPGACRRAVRSRHPSGERAIADFLGIPLWDLWPDRWRQQDGAAVRIDHRQGRRHGKKIGVISPEHPMKVEVRP